MDVLRVALERFGDIQLVNSTAQDAQQEADMTQEQGFIVNRAEHWFTLRRIGQRWFNLNSMLPKPEEVRPFYLSAFLAQLQEDGYSVFIVRGTGLPAQGFPDEADLIGGESGMGGGRWYRVSDLVGGGASTSQGKPPAKKGGEQKDEGGGSYWSRFGLGHSVGGGGQTLGGGTRVEPPPPSSTTAPAPAEMTEEEELARAIALSLEK